MCANHLISVYSNLDVFEFYRAMERHEVLLAFKGDITQDMLHSILNIMEDKLSRLNEPTRVRKRVVHILVECMQNLYHHSDLPDGPCLHIPSSLLMVAKCEDTYCIVTGNFVANNSVKALEKRLQAVNDMEPEELKSYYKSLLNNDQMSKKGGGGLGIVDIAKKTTDKLDYFFVPYDAENSFFSLLVKVH